MYRVWGARGVAPSWTFYLGVSLPLTSCTVREGEGGGTWAMTLYRAGAGRWDELKGRSPDQLET